MNRVDIPQSWTPDQALAVVAFLERVIAEIWAAHGRPMRDRIYQLSELLEVERPPAPNPNPPSTDPDDDIPF